MLIICVSCATFDFPSWRLTGDKLPAVLASLKYLLEPVAWKSTSIDCFLLCEWIWERCELLLCNEAAFVFLNSMDIAFAVMTFMCKV